MTNVSAVVAGNVFFNTNISAAVSTVTVMLIRWIRYKKPDVSMTLNGSLAGLVAITAGCDMVDPTGAALIGIIAGCAVVFGIELLDKKAKIDDPVGAVGVHGICGALGTILTAVFATESNLAATGMTRIEFLGTQAIGVLSVAGWAAVTIFILFLIIKKTIGLRVSAEEEISGLDLPEHGLVSAYADFMPMSNTASVKTVTVLNKKGEVPVDEAVPVTLKTAAPDKISASDVKMSKIEIITKQERFEALKTAMLDIGITGMTVTNVLGCGAQRGKPEYYRGVAQDISLLPKIQVEIVVCKVPVKTVIETAKKVLYTGHIGDGKIFVYDVEHVVKVRTGEEDYDALQDVE